MEEKEYGMGAVMNAFRLLMVGALKGPHLFDIIAHDWTGRDVDAHSDRFARTGKKGIKPDFGY